MLFDGPEEEARNVLANRAGSVYSTRLSEDYKKQQTVTLDEVDPNAFMFPERKGD